LKVQRISSPRRMVEGVDPIDRHPQSLLMDFVFRLRREEKAFGYGRPVIAEGLNTRIRQAQQQRDVR